MLVGGDLSALGPKQQQGSETAGPLAALTQEFLARARSFSL